MFHSLNNNNSVLPSRNEVSGPFFNKKIKERKKHVVSGSSAHAHSVTFIMIFIIAIIDFYN